MTIQEFKIRIEELEQLEQRCSKAEKEYENDPMNEMKELNFDILYKEEYAAFDSICKILVQLTGIEYKTARLMLRTKINEMIEILERCA